MDSRYKFFNTVWNSELQANFKGLPTEDLFSLFDNVNNTQYTIPKEFQYRPDLIANLFYGDPKLFWVLVYANHFNNSPEDFETGAIILIPSYQRVVELL